MFFVFNFSPVTQLPDLIFGECPAGRWCIAERAVGDISPDIGKNMDFHVQSILIFSQNIRFDITNSPIQNGKNYPGCEVANV